MHTITIPTAIYEAAAGPKGNRPVLKGVCVEREDENTARLTASDGHILASVTASADLPVGFKPIIVPAALVKAAYKYKTLPNLYIDGDEIFVMAKDGGRLSGSPIGGAFPNWRKLIPQGYGPSQPYDGYHMSLDPKLIVRACKAIDSEHATLLIATPSSPAVMANEHGIAVIMPMFAKGDDVAERLAEFHKANSPAEAVA